MITHDAKSIGENLYKIRKKTRLSQDEVAWQAGLSSRTYADIERGTVNARIDSLIKICNVFDVTLDDIAPSTTETYEERKERLSVQLELLPQDRRETALNLLEVYMKSLMP